MGQITKTYFGFYTCVMVYEIQVHIYNTFFQIHVLIIIFGRKLQGVGTTFFKTQRCICSARAHLQKPLLDFV